MAKVTIAKLQEKNLQLEAQIEKLKSESGTADIISGLEATIAEQASIIEELSKDNASKSVSSSSEVVKVEGTEYKLIAPSVIVDGSTVTFDNVKSNPDLAQKLVALKILVTA